jgi:hypothetical protein
MFIFYTFYRCMEVCVASRDWCVKHLSWILMRESVSVVTLFPSARNCFLKLRAGLNPYLRVYFGCLLLEMFQMKLRYDIVCDAIDLVAVLPMTGTSF